MIKKTLHFLKNYYVFIIVIFLIIGFFKIYNENKSNRIKLEKNPKFTIGQIIGTEGGGKHTNVLFRYYINGKEFVNREYAKGKGGFDIYGFYPVRYDGVNPKNSEILVSKRKYSFEEILKKNTIIAGKIDKIIKYRDNYYDVQISYSIKDCKYSFESRLTLNDLDCNPSLDCLKSNIDLKVSSIYPRLNNIYILSVDRTEKIKSDFRININSECN